MEKNMLMASTCTNVPAINQVINGVKKGAKTVEVAVIPTERAKSPLAK